MRLAVNDARLLDLLGAWGIPYSYGAGTPLDGAHEWPPEPLPKGIGGGRGFDCSGFVQAALVHLGLLPATAPDRAAATLYQVSSPVTEAERLGDMAFYGVGRISHVMLCLGDGAVLGACGGTPSTNGTDRAAYVQVKPLRYRSDFRGVRRLAA